MKHDMILKHERHQHIEFLPDSHRYFYNCEGRKIEFDGVTSWIGKYTSPFNPDIAKYIAYRDGTTEEEVVAGWDKARGYGKFVDKMIGDYIDFGKNENVPEVKFFKQAMDEMELEVVASELIIYNEDVKRASGVDVIARDKDKNYVVVDLKSMAKPIEYHGYRNKKMKKPIRTLNDSKYFKQALQVGTYKYWLKTKYDLPVSENGYVLRIRPEFYQWLPMMNVQKEVELMHEHANRN